ncbi:hypothetical protein HZY83_06585, partial [Gemella sp. GH3]|uniref:CD3337/EF1877 family mobilome membrane protein n=1 Tax=unclassified Gemella TaxID=2624949 RepID=UPI0015D0AB84
MKKLKRISYIAISTLMLFFSTILIAYANNIDEKYNNLEQYKSYMVDGNVLLPNMSIMFNVIVNWLFGIAKFFASITDFFLKYLYDNKALDSIVDVLSDMSSRIYENIFGQVGALLFVIAVLFIGVRYLTRNGRGIREAINLFIVIGIGVLWITNSGTIIRTANGLSSELQGIIASSGNKITETAGISDSNSGVDLMREKAFEKMVEQPFLILNFNTIDKKDVKKESLDVMLSSNISTKDKQKELKKLELDDKDYDVENGNQNYYISDESVSEKMLTAFFSIIMNLLYMIPFSIIAFFSFIIQVQILFYILVIPFAIMLSMIPGMSSNYVIMFKKLLGMYLLKAMLGLIVLFIDIVMALVSKIMESTTSPALTTYSVSTIMFLVAILSLYKKRTEIASTFANNQYTKDLSAGVKGLDTFRSGISNIKQGVNDYIKDRQKRKDDEQQLINKANNGTYEEQEITQRINDKGKIIERTSQTEEIQDYQDINLENNDNVNDYVRQNQSDYIENEDTNLESRNNYKANDNNYVRKNQKTSYDEYLEESKANYNDHKNDLPYKNNIDYNSRTPQNNFNNEIKDNTNPYKIRNTQYRNT